MYKNIIDLIEQAAQQMYLARLLMVHFVRKHVLQVTGFVQN